ncbi:SubName: Full=Uncharacterized protein {ECO:0000313/EMBL:CCA66523.1} [Serendipita indica DSM 11827]|nr:SubName: Full=Uncharacterized protein {ECO:0000313/EMBL:CCA66523.1} [Serendipita indica DSM 11827]
MDAVRVLSGSRTSLDGPKHSLEQVLESRLARLNEFDIPEIANHITLPGKPNELRHLTGSTEFRLLQEIDKILCEDPNYEVSMNDQAALRAAVSVAVRWKIDTDTNNFNAATSQARNAALQQLTATVNELLKIIFPEPATTNRVAPTRVVEEGSQIRAATLRILSSFSLSESIHMLGVVLNIPHLPVTARNAIRYLLTRRILPQNGVKALLSGLLGQESHSGELLERYEKIAKLLCTPPRGLDKKEYFFAIIPQLLGLLEAETASPVFQRACAYTLSRLTNISSSDPVVLSTISATLYSSFSEDSSSPSFPPLQTLVIVSNLVAMAPPSPDAPLTTKVLMPIIEKLYSLLYFLDKRLTSDPAETALCRSLVQSWMKISTETEVSQKLWSIVLGNGGRWIVAGENLTLQWQREFETPLPLLNQLANLDLDAMDENSLNLVPDPIHLVELIHSVNRQGIVSQLFTRILSAELEEVDQDEPTRKLLRMQILYQLQKRMPSSLFGDPTQALAFVDHAIALSRRKTESEDNHQEPLRIVSDANEEDEGKYSTQQSSIYLPPHPKYTIPDTNPHVSRLTEYLKALSFHSSQNLRQVAREASLVLMAKRASASSSTREQSTESTSEKESQKMYQEALAMLQDPLLPVRAQGLATLRRLIEGLARHGTRSSEPSNEDSFIFLNAVQGLIAMAQQYGRDVFKRLIAIYGIERHTIGIMTRQELDVKLRVGEALAEVVGKTGESMGGYADLLLPVILAMLRDRDLPVTLRVSAISIASKAEAVAPFAIHQYEAELTGAMLDILELEHIRRTEAISQRQKENPGIEESGPTVSTLKKDNMTGARSILDEEALNGEEATKGVDNRQLYQPQRAELGDIEMDTNPTGANAKMAPLRRSAIHFLRTVLQRHLQTVVDQGKRVYTGGGGGLREFPVRRASAILGYLSLHDADGMVNVMASEAVDLISEIGKARLFGGY